MAYWNIKISTQIGAIKYAKILGVFEKRNYDLDKKFKYIL